jgi:type IV pilus assembly protein PilP
MIKNLHPKNSRTCVVMAILGVMMSVPGCKKKEQQPVAPPPVKPVVSQQPKPVQKQVSSALKLPSPPVNQFDFSNKKDPFKPYVIVKSGVAQGEKQQRKELLPIHSFDVSQFKLIGIVMTGKENKAMVVDPQGKGYVLKVGMTIGKNDGRITAITNNSVNVVERFKDDNGRVHKENITITLPRKQ